MRLPKRRDSLGASFAVLMPRATVEVIGPEITRHDAIAQGMRHNDGEAVGHSDRRAPGSLGNGGIVTPGRVFAVATGGASETVSEWLHPHGLPAERPDGRLEASGNCLMSWRRSTGSAARDILRGVRWRESGRAKDASVYRLDSAGRSNIIVVRMRQPHWSTVFGHDIAWFARMQRCNFRV